MIPIDHLLWDTQNTAHIARHNITPEEVENVCHGIHIVRQTYKGRVILIGPTANLEVITIVLDHERENIYYPVTARPASRKERTAYQKEIGGEEK